MNKKFIEFMKRTSHKFSPIINNFVYCTVFIGKGSAFDDYEYDKMREVKPADLLGSQIAFLNKQNWFIRQVIWDGQFYNILILHPDQANIEGIGSTFQEAFDAAFDKVLELIEA